jgi:hypothetical protein
MPNRRSRLDMHWRHGFSHTDYLASLRVCRSAQYNVAAKMPKAVAIMRTTIVSVAIEYSLASLGTHRVGDANRRL